MRKAAFLLLLAAVGLALNGCRKQAFPDPHYERASRTYQALFSTSLDDSYADPKMDGVLFDLRKVDEASSDAEPARALVRVIEEGRVKLANDRAAREKLSLAAQAAARAIPKIDVDGILAANAPPDAGLEVNVVDPYGSGASVAEINVATGGCLAGGDQPFTEQGTNKAGTLYRLSTGSICADKLPGFVGQVVMVTPDGRIYRRIPASLVPEPTLPSVADAGVARQQAQVKAQAQAGAADAGELLSPWVPGLPQRGYQPPADAGE